MRKTLAWLVTLPFAAVSIMLGHTVAYRVTGTPLGDVHGYLEHAPQVVLVLASIALLGLAVDARARRTSPLPLAALAAAGFVVQEHLERLLHTGELPILVTSPGLWLGVLLQLPLAAVVWLVCRRLADELAAPARRLPPRLARLPVALTAAADTVIRPAAIAATAARGPPVCS